MTRLPTLLLGSAMSLAWPVAAHADAGDRWLSHDMMGGGWFMGLIMLLIVLAVVVVAVLIALKLAGVSGEGGSTSRSALEILQERYARGEIDKAEFDERRRTLAGG